jgi:4-hydroxy-tetrahydrodipicolinate reductase
MSKSLRIGIIGATGRMGKQLIQLVAGGKGACVGAAVAHEQSSALGKDAGQVAGVDALGVEITADIKQAAAAVDVLIDFSLPVALVANLAAAAAAETPIVVCTTGLSDSHKKQLEQTSESTAVLYAANTSLGVNVLLNLVRMASKALGSRADIEILEAHHTAKRDAPSGTALALGEAAASGRGQTLASVAEYQRNHSEEPYAAGSIGFASLRAGDIVGEHTVYLVSGGERLELTHRVADRATFAEGALNAGVWLAARPAGFYTMNHVLGLDD